MLQQQFIRLSGTVQAVGMRPALARLAARFQLVGEVVNRSGAVELWLGGENARLQSAVAALPDALPVRADAVKLQLEPPETVAELRWSSFDILTDDSAPAAINLLGMPDLAPCAECRRELFDAGDRRYHYAFNSCGECGARATVIAALPYERDHTAWREFPMCPDCRAEYADIRNRRYHIQSTSCPHCGPILHYLAADGTNIADGDAAVTAAAAAIDAGQIVALKGVGGFQYLVDAANTEAIGRLRQLKHRPRKPLALMARDLDIVRRLCVTDSAAEAALCDPAAPIVLLEWRDNGLARGIAPDAPDSVGIMLPSSPLHLLLMAELKTPLIVATSGNSSGMPPALELETARSYAIGAGFLTHDREIRHRHDDSVAALTAGQMRLWRRGRGYPWQLNLPDIGIAETVIALGAENKNAFAAAGTRNHLAWTMLSSDQGGLGALNNFEAWQNAVDFMLDHLPEAPRCVAVDLHRDYAATIYGEKLAARRRLPLIRVQHHYAHALAALWESGFNEALALVWDGTGLGLDGTIWGGELLYVSKYAPGERLAWFDAAPLPGGEAAIRMPLRQYYARAWQSGMALPPDDEAQMIKLMCEQHLNTPLSSAAGRIFDAFAARIGLARHPISFEGEAAIALEYRARCERRAGLTAQTLPYKQTDGVFDLSEIWRLTTLPAAAALSFHQTMAEIARAMINQGMARKTRLPILLTGGCFQNRLLSELVVARLNDAAWPWFMPTEIPVNDAGIAIGQLAAAGLRLELKH